MQTVSVTEFRGNIKKYLEIAEKEKLVIHRNKGASFVVMPLNDMDETSLLSEAQKKAIDQGLQAISKGNFVTDEEARTQINDKHPGFFK